MATPPLATSDEIEAALHEAAGGRARLARLDDAALTVMLDVAGLDEGERSALEDVIRSELGVLIEGRALRIAMTAERSKPKLIAVGSGKGGVGKSTLAANLAVAMARRGRAVGLVDADIYGPSIPTLMGREGVRPEAEGKKLVPVASAYDVPFLSMGQLVGAGQAVAWRGPMAGKALGQLIDAHWGDARELVIDLPPGTGDIQLSMVQGHKPAAAVIVSTPQDLSLIDAARAIGFFDKAGVPVIGLVENMAGYVCPHCGELSDPFGRGGAEAAARALDLPFLGRIPLDIAIRSASDGGVPPAAGDSVQGGAFMAIADKVIDWMDSQGSRTDAA
ncbi:Mrp/NBP35 family ATP-binding protein [Novosphingopyxis sp.]|uniref:Mrp/NBP35 family ATP-binding protein n=1 Tax=Novosphingopyxis sp. TaxID=2709690 RepID=UPI003B5BD09C